KLAELEKSGEAANTIVFFYSDHGGTVPRGKGYLYESGTHVPFIAYFPEKWKHLAAMPLPAVSDRLVSFVDFAPTVLNLAGVEIPGFMTGKPFFGKGSGKPGNQHRYIFTFRANQGNSFAPARAITDGAYKLIWNYQSAYPNGTRQDYQWQMPAQQAWDIAERKGALDPLQEKFWRPVETFELYNIKTDSLETRNLAGDKNYRRIFKRLKTALQRTVREHNDLGFIPREYRKTLQEQDALYLLSQENKIGTDRQIRAAETASLRKVSNLEVLTGYLSDSDPVIQYWGSSGICGLAKTKLIDTLPAEVAGIMEQQEIIPEVKCMLAEAMVYAGDREKGLNYLLTQLKEGFGPAAAALQNVGGKAMPLVNELRLLLSEPGKNRHKFYIRSTLINCDALPYSALYPINEKVTE
ncbi:MAG TPA: sulfatase/phosphatase domain-containing protein, partial [Anseongella sp.]|nr:sulfatase/phosphatase domain-containing protein [Anseongella sp.]